MPDGSKHLNELFVYHWKKEENKSNVQVQECPALLATWPKTLLSTFMSQWCSLWLAYRQGRLFWHIFPVLVLTPHFIGLFSGAEVELDRVAVSCA